MKIPRLFTAMLCLVASALNMVASTREAAINLHWVRDWLPPILADAMQSNRGRAWQAVGTSTDLPAADLDADGWPKKDAEIALWHGQPASRTGVYTMHFEGRATVSILWTSNATLLSNVYDSATNKSVVTFRLNSPTEQLRLRFAQTSGGVRKVRVMLPISAGSSTSHGANEILDRVMQAQMSRMSIIRYMDAQNTNSAPETTWSSRAIPGSRRNLTGFNPFAGATTTATSTGYVGAHTSTGIPFEYIIAIANATDTDAFICVPAMADETFIRKMAQVFRYGSDGVEPYTAPQSNPVWPPLESGRKLYVEYSNEVWNTVTGFRQNHYSRYEAIRLVQENLQHPLNTRHTLATSVSTVPDHLWALRARFTAWRAAEMSRILREVFPDQIMDRVRPLFCYQIRKQLVDVVPELMWAHRHYLETENRGLPYFFWGSGPANYRDIGSNTATTVDDLFTLGTLGYQAHYDQMVFNANISHSLGLRLMTYEGGPSYGDALGGSSDWHPLAPQAFVDPRAYGKVMETHDVLERLGGSFGTLYVWHHGYAWSFVHPDTHSDNTHRAQAMYDSRGATRQAAQHGRLIPASWAGKSFQSYDPGWKNNQTAATGSQTLSVGERIGYVVRSTAGGFHRVRIRYRTAGATEAFLSAMGQPMTKIVETAAVSTAKDSANFRFWIAPGAVGGISLTNTGANSLTVDSVTVESASESFVPVIIEQPGALERAVGQTAGFRVVAQGNPAPSYQWFREGVAISGATSPTLTLNNVQAAQAGLYTVRASNSAGAVTSATARLTVTGGSTPPPSGALATWDFAGTSGAASVPPTSVASGVVMSPISFGAGLNANHYYDGHGFTATAQGGLTLADAIAANDYLGITVQPQSGKTLTLTQLEISPISQNRVRSFAVLSSIDGFSSGAAIGVFTYGGIAANTPFVVQLPDHDGLSGPVEIRIYVYGQTNIYEAVGLGRVTGVDFTVKGSVAP